MNLNLMIGMFYNKFGHLAEANGFKLIKNSEKNGLIDASYKWNAVKFSFKAFQYIWHLSLMKFLVKLHGLMQILFAFKKFIKIILKNSCLKMMN